MRVLGRTLMKSNKKFASPLVMFFGCLLFLSGCAGTPDMIGADNPRTPVRSTPGVALEKIFIVTTREASEAVNVFYSDKRAPEIGYAEVTVSIPPNHVPGALEVPKRLPPNPHKEFAVIDPIVYAKDTAFINSVNRELAKRPASEQDVLFFIHGYNNTTTEAVLRLAQFVKDSGFKGVPILFTWASAGKTSNYVYDLNSTLVARSVLPEVFETLARTNGREFSAFAHSMGSFLLMEAVVQAELAGNFNTTGRLESIILASPDIDVDLFRTQVSQIDVKNVNFFVLASEDDRALRFSQTISGGVSRVGAANAEELSGHGITLIDLSEVDDSRSSSHSKFAGSPEVVQLLGRGLNAQHLAPDDTRATMQEYLVGLPIRVFYD